MRTCHTCGHSHPIMASSWRSDTGVTRWYCHENDHSCYTMKVGH